MNKPTLADRAQLPPGYSIVGWEPIKTAPQDRFIFLYCPEDKSRWFAKWQDGRWFGVDDEGLTREGHSEGDPEVVTGWAVRAWQDLPDCPVSFPAPSPSMLREVRRAALTSTE